MSEVPPKFPLSALNQYAYCPRRCALILAEGEFEDNVHTLQGSQEHHRVDQVHHVCEAGIRAEYALPVWSDELGLSGRCDVVEFRPDGTVCPVEHKHGPRKRYHNDDLQVAAQALCLEEMLGVRIDSGAIYHRRSRRRRVVEISPELRAAVREAVQDIRSILAAPRLPPPTENTYRCGECSLKNICLPELLTVRGQIRTLHENLFEVGDSA